MIPRYAVLGLLAALAVLHKVEAINERRHRHEWQAKHARAEHTSRLFYGAFIQQQAELEAAGARIVELEDLMDLEKEFWHLIRKEGWS